MVKCYYFISDLHINGDDDFYRCDFEDELINFLKNISNDNCELIIVGDTFEMWNDDIMSPINKVKKIISKHTRLFSNFKKYGKLIKITIIIGNHDFELLLNPKIKTLLAKYNINLEKKESIVRKINGKKIFIEHGHQEDVVNKLNIDNGYLRKPIGYFASNFVYNNISKRSVFGKRKWLEDIESVYPNELIPSWLFSNYFYKEMSPVLRWILVPFILMFTLNLIILGSFLFDVLANTNFSSFFDVTNLGFLGRIIDFVFAINFYTLMIIFILFIPIKLFAKDINKVLFRYGFGSKNGLKLRKEQHHIDRFKAVSKIDKDIAVYVYGHTHLSSFKKINNKIIINTGSWLKRLNRIKPRSIFLPSIYHPSYRLGYFKIYSKNKKIVIDYTNIDKKVSNTNLTWLEKIIIFRRKKTDNINIPKRTIL
jgi:UDP-2,3-diacylglucosamine pyrophosphatase LpxH